ncbi:hypothetical protein RMCBS344292_15671 [Rhizopus microsporus]|nr:hypothetical protein RMCBS344292_15671 [Rhizopus microsporus]
MADRNSTSFGSVFASGIQDVAAVAAVLGTDICNKNAGMSLTKGYLFPAACGMSMFGVLGLAKHILKSFLPLHIAENLGIEVEKFDTYRIDKAMHKEATDMLAKKKEQSYRNVKVYMDTYSYSEHMWIPALISCLLLPCVNFIPYILHYRTLYLNSEDSPDLSDSYLYFPLLLTFSSFMASFICWFDAAIMLSGFPSLYPMAGHAMRIFICPDHFGSLFARRIGYVIGLLAAVDIISGYIGSYLVVQKMTSTDTYYWLGLKLALCFARLVV